MFYILSAANTVGIIRSTVSITFIINLDEMFYNACVSNTIKKSITETAYEVKHSKLWCACLFCAVLRPTSSSTVQGAVACVPSASPPPLRPPCRLLAIDMDIIISAPNPARDTVCVCVLVAAGEACRRISSLNTRSVVAEVFPRLDFA